MMNENRSVNVCQLAVRFWDVCFQDSVHLPEKSVYGSECYRDRGGLPILN